MVPLHRLLVFLPLLVLALVARGEVLLTMDEAAREMAQRNPELAAARETLNAALARQQAATANYFPQLSASARYDRLGGERFLLSPGTDAYGFGVDARQNLFEGLKTQAGVAFQRARVDAAQANFNRVAARISSDLKSAYSDLLFAQENRDLARKILARRKDNLDLVELRFEGGREHKGSYLRIKAAHREAEFGLAQAERDISVAQTRLARVLARDLNDVLIATGTFQTAIPLPAPNFTSLTHTTPDVQIAEADRRANDSSLTVARGDYWPRLDATLSHSWTDEQWVPGTRSWRGGVALSLPLFTGGSTYQNVRSAQAEVKRAEAVAAQVFSQTFLALRSAWTDLQNARGNVDVQKEFMEAANTRALISRGQYTSGLLSFDDWDLIENDLIQSHKQFLAAQRISVRAEAAWENAQGKGWIP
ncbi:MAG: TolC family protein [Elusimicrobia bacterium]|nr:TolC family protein [Elusimicrobiota bacterium]